MALNVYEMYAKLGLDSSEYEKGLDKAGKKGSVFGDVLKANLVTKGVDVAVKGLAKLGSVAVDTISQATSAYGEYEQLKGGVETLFGDSAQKVLEDASNAFNTAGMSMNQYMETSIQSAASLINSLEGDQSKAAELMNVSIIDMADNVNKMGTTMEAVQNAYRGFSRGNFTMLDNLALGFAGTKQGMQDLLKQAKEISGIKYDINSYADIVEAIHVVQQEMGVSGTTAAEAAGTIQGSVSAVKSAWANLVAGFANPDADLGQLIDNLVTTGTAALENLVPTIERALTGIGNAIQKIAPVISKELPKLINDILPSLLEALSTLITGLIEALPSIMETLAETLMQVLKDIIKELPSILDSLLDAIFIIIDGILEALPDIIQTLAEAIPKIVTTLITKIAENLPIIIQGLIDVVLAIVDALPTIIIGFIDALPTIIVSVITAIIESLPIIIQGLIQLIIAIVEHLPEIIEALIEAIPLIIEAIITAFAPIVEKIVGVLGRAFDAIATWFGNLIDSIVGWFSDIWDSITTWFSNLIDSIVGWFSDIWDSITTWFGNLIDSIVGFAKKAFEAGKKFVVSIWEGFSSWAVEVWNNITNWVSDLWRGIADFFSNAWELGKSIVEGIWNGITGAAQWLWDKITGWLSSIWDGIKSFFGISSPSKQMSWIAQMMVEGLGGGLDKYGDIAVKRALALSESIDNVFTSMGGYDIPITMNDVYDNIDNTVDFLDVPAFGEDNLVDEMSYSIPQNPYEGRELTVVLELDRTQLAKTIYKLNGEETQRVGVRLAGV